MKPVEKVETGFEKVETGSIIFLQLLLLKYFDNIGLQHLSLKTA